MQERNWSETFNNLSEEEKKVALEILKQYSQEGKSSLLDDLKYADFEEIPVDIHTFLHDKKYLGNALYDQDGRFTLFPYWEEKLQDVFPDNLTTKYNTIILTGSIGIGKSTFAVICLLYMLYRLCANICGIYHSIYNYCNIHILLYSYWKKR